MRGEVKKMGQGKRTFGKLSRGVVGNVGILQMGSAHGTNRVSFISTYYYVERLGTERKGEELADECIMW